MYVSLFSRCTRFRDDVEVCFVELGGTGYEIVRVNKKGTKCRVRCSGVDSSSTLPGCSDATFSLTVKGNGDSCDLADEDVDDLNAWLLNSGSFGENPGQFVLGEGLIIWDVSPIDR